MTGLFDKFKEEDSEGGIEMVAERPVENEENKESIIEETQEQYNDNSGQTDTQTNFTSTTTDDIGISSLMNKRAKLEEAVDYVGMLISNLKDKRTSLEKEIEDESVDIKNLKEKLIKVG